MRLSPRNRNGDTTTFLLFSLGGLVLAGVGVWLVIRIEASRQWAQKEGARADFKEQTTREARREVELLTVQLRAEVTARQLAETKLAELRRLMGEEGRQPADADEKPEDLIDQARKSLQAGDADKAVTALDRAIKLDEKNARAHFLRGRAHEMLDRHEKAVADFSRALDLDSKNVEALNSRGSEYFKLGKIKESVEDFDAYVKARPEQLNGHWKRGIALYYAGRFDDGRKQFEGYEKVDTNDVENAVWHFLCVARKDGVEKARQSLLKIGRDRRPEMMDVYDLFAGKIKPDKLPEAVDRGKPDDAEKTRRLFYVHLYLGLYHEVAGEPKAALEHLTKAADLPKVHHFMWDVARVHRDLLKKKG